MKIRIISDIHGNAKALEAVLEKLDNKVDKIICLGDLVGGAPMSEKVVQNIMNLKKELIIVMGNRERYIIEGLPIIVHDEKIKVSKEQIDRNEWVRQELSDLSKEFINSLNKQLIYEVNGKKIYIAHYPINEKGNFRKHIKGATAEENEVMFLGIEADIYLYGHTHEEIYNVKNNKMYINPGALGCPGKTQNAPYGILDISNGEVKYEQLHAKYDVQEVIDCIQNVKFPGYKDVLEVFYGFDK